MATLYKRGKLWWARWYRTDGTRTQASTKTEKRRDADRIAAELEAADRRKDLVEPTHASEYVRILTAAAQDAERGDLTPKRAEELLLKIRRVASPDFKIPTLYETITAWQKDMDPRVGPSTSQGYKDMVTAIKAATKDCPLPDFTHEDAKRLVHALKKTGRKVKGPDGKLIDETRTAATANQHFRAFRRAMQSAVQAQTITFNPATGIPPLPETDSTERVPFTTADIHAMLTHPFTSEEWRGTILIAAHTGLRIGDVVRLTRAHVEGTRIVIRPKKTEKNRKTLTVPLTPQVLAFIGEKTGPIFPTLSKAKKGTLSTQFARIMTKAGIEQPPAIDGHKATKTFHSLRHTFTSWLANAEVPQDVRQKLTGHSDAGIHALYSHYDEALDKAIGKLPTL